MIVRRCSMCSAEENVAHFRLVHPKRTNGKETLRGAGSIDLCQRCWREAIERSAVRARPRTAARTIRALAVVA